MDNGGTTLIRDDSINYLQDPQDGPFQFQNLPNINSQSSFQDLKLNNEPSNDSPIRAHESNSYPFKTFLSEPFVNDNQFQQLLPNSQYTQNHTVNPPKIPKFDEFLQSLQKTLMLKIYTKSSPNKFLEKQVDIKMKHGVLS